MKFMITWKLHPATRHEVLDKFSTMTTDQEAALMGPEMKMLGRWHDLVEGKGVAICESDNAAAVSAYCQAWNPYMDLELSMVLDDDETRAIGKSMAG